MPRNGQFIHGLKRQRRFKEADPEWQFWRQVAMDDMNDELLLERVKRRDAEEGTHNVQHARWLMKAIADLEADMALARDALRLRAEHTTAEALLPADYEPGLRWLETFSTSTRTLGELRAELRKLTEDDRMYNAAVGLKEAQKNMVEGATGNMQILFSPRMARPGDGIEVLSIDGNEDGNS